MDMQRLVELIKTTDDIELLVKLFSVLAAHLVSNDTYKGDIITSNIIYDKIRNVLSNGQSYKTVRTLNFITALLYMNEEDEGPSRAKTLVLYAQNMIRISGCLLIMCNMFTSCMLHQEIWRALCQCLTESCRKSTENQSYCSHLVPMAIQKCIRGNVEAMEILKSLINNHDYNIQLFVESNGISIFSRRDTLLNDTSMQLLSSIVQNSTPEMLAIVHETVFQNLSHIKRLYGTRNRIGQWATIIWHHLNSRKKVPAIGFDDKKDLNRDNGKEIVNNESSVIDIEFLKPDDTAKLLQNVIREIHQYNAKNSVIHKIGRHIDDMKSSTQDNFKVRNKNQSKKHLSHNKESDMKTHANESKILLEPNLNETSFSFLLHKHSQGTKIEFLKNNKSSRFTITENPPTTHNSISVQKETKTSNMPNNHFSQRDVTFSSDASVYNNEDPSLLEFNPIYVSTPKKNKRHNDFLQSSPRFRLNITNKEDKIVNKTIKKARYSKDKVYPRRDLKNRSMTSRVFHAINNSCTTFVKTVKNIFKSKKNDDISKLSASSPFCTKEISCSYSFTDYMRKRDALLATETVKTSFGEVRETENIKSCKTCNDTVSLKHKVNNDQHLKETVTKLKLGINLYGCDFKKISKALWPRETYMTPEVLYNLYRKLIIK